MAILTTAVMLVVALPALGTVWSPVDSAVIPKGDSARVVADSLQRDFAGAGRSPVTVAITASRAQASTVKAYATRVSRLPAVTKVTPPRLVGPFTWQLDASVAGDPAGASAQRLVSDIRRLSSPVTAHVSGDAAAFVDQQAAIQHGRLTGLLGYTSNGGVEPTDFLVTATLVFALSTDYGVFLLGRIQEAHDAGAENREAVAAGLGRTGRVVTAAAILLAVAIGAFSTSSISFIQQIGLATATGVLIDALHRPLAARAIADGAARRAQLVLAATPQTPAPADRACAGTRRPGAGAPRPGLVTPGRRGLMIRGAVPSSATRFKLVLAWYPVVVVPPVLLVDAAVSAEGKPITALGVLAAIVSCLPLVFRRRVPFRVLLVPLVGASCQCSGSCGPGAPWC